jgi:hypothetical protein
LSGVRRAIIGERVLTIDRWRQRGGPNDPPRRRLGGTVDPDFFVKLTGRLVADLKPPWPDAVNASRQFDKETTIAFSQAGAAAAARFPLTYESAPTFGAIVHSGARCQARAAMCDAAIAIELFRRQTGQWPVNLNELVPRFLPAVPLDPFHGKPLRYFVGDGEYRLYSIGSDRLDNGGKDKGGGIPDVVFAVPLQ